MAANKTHFIGQLQRPRERPENVELIVDAKRPGIPSAALGTSIYTVIATSYTVADEDLILVDDDTAGGDVTVTLPPATAANTQPRHIKKLGTTGDVVIDANSTETIDGGLTATLTQQYEALMIISDGTNWHII